MSTIVRLWGGKMNQIDNMMWYVKIGIGIAAVCLIIYLWNCHCEKVQRKNECEERQKKLDKERNRLNSIQERLTKNPVFLDIMKKIHTELDNIIAISSSTPIGNGYRHFYIIHIFSTAITTGDYLGTNLPAFTPNKSHFLFSSYNKDKISRDYILVFPKAICADISSHYPFPTKVEEPSHGIDGDYYEEGYFYVKIDLTDLHPKYNSWE